jgi:hypothetical protein
MWKVRSIRRVPGSPIECAASTPTVTEVNRTTGRKHAPIALGTHAVAGFTGEYGTHPDVLKTCCRNFRKVAFVHEFACLDNHFVCDWMLDVIDRGATEKTFFKRNDCIVPVLECGYFDAVRRTAVFLGNHEIQAHVHKTAC